MKHKTAELTGALLDLAVHKALELSCYETLTAGFPELIPYSTSWGIGGPIIDREHINLTGRYRNGRPSSEWCADMGKLPLHFGPTALIAAMRAFVASRFGEEIEL